jgi:hypothetical protein
MARLYIPNSVALRNFDALFTSNDFLFTDRTVDIKFHPKYVAMHPVALSFYAALADRFREENIDVNASINRRIRSVPFLQRMGLFSTLGFLNPVKTAEHEETGRFIPLRKLSTATELSAFLKTIDPILHTTQENSRVIKHVFSELLRNVLEHSRAPFGGNVCATYNRNKKKISIGISDAGIGIFESMRFCHKLDNHQASLIAALTPGITGTTARIGGSTENAGAGLFFTKCIAQATRNHFLIYSGDSYYKLKLTPPYRDIDFIADPLADYHSARTSLPFFKGTLIGLDIHIANTEAFNHLIERIGSAYQLGVKQTQKDYYSRIRFI